MTENMMARTGELIYLSEPKVKREMLNQLDKKGT